MAYLFKRKSIWYIGWTEKKYINGVLRISQKAVTTKCSSKQLANIKLQEFNSTGKPLTKQILCSEFLRRYLEFGTRKQQHKVNIRIRFENLIQFCGDRSMDLYDTEDIDSFLSMLLNEKHFSEYTVKGYRADLHCGFRQAMIWKYVKENPVFYSRTVKPPEPEILFFSKIEFNMFLNSIGSDLFRDIAIFTLFTGLRAGDICNIKLSDIFLDLKYIRITATNTHNPKNQKTNWTEIADELVPLLEKYLNRNREYLFETKYGTKLATSYLCNRFKLLVIASGVSKRHSHKSLRKTFASWLYEATQDIRQVYPHLHHSKPEVSLKHYAKLVHPNYTGVTNLISYKEVD